MQRIIDPVPNYLSRLLNEDSDSRDPVKDFVRSSGCVGHTSVRQVICVFVDAQLRLPFPRRFFFLLQRNSQKLSTINDIMRQIARIKQIIPVMSIDNPVFLIVEISG